MKLRSGFLVFCFVAVAAIVLPSAAFAADAPAGCVVCHKGDKALPTLLATVKGHPNIAKIVKSVPDGCAMCHKAGAKVPDLKTVVHAIPAHKVTAAKDAKAADVKGSCLMCHTVTGTTVSTKKAPANW